MAVDLLEDVELLRPEVVGDLDDSPPTGRSKLSPRLCAASVLMTRVRWPRRAARRAVAAATLVLPTPPLPV